MRKIVGSALLGCAAVASCWWFWSLGRLPSESARQMTLKIDHDPVEVSHGTGPWEQAKDGMALASSDHLRTGAGGAAIVRVYRKGEIRLRERSELTFVRAEEQQMGVESMTVEAQLVMGRVWTRLLRLADLGSSFSLRTNAVTATVRGTAFDLLTDTTGTLVYVDDGAVQASSVASEGKTRVEPPVISQGFSALFDVAGNLRSTGPAKETVRQSDWVVQNEQRDSAMLQRMTDELTAEMTSWQAKEPGSLRDMLAKLSEKLRMQMNAAQAPELYARYTERRLFAIQRLILNGGSGQAQQALSQLEEDVSGKLHGSQADQYRAALKGRIPQMLFLLQDTSPASPSYRLKQRTEDLVLELSDADPLESAYARLLSVDARLDEAVILIRDSSLDDAKSVLDTARQGMSNVERDIDHLSGDVSSERREALRAKLNALKARETSLRTRLATAVEPPTPTFVGSDALGVPTSTAALPGTPTSTAATTSTSPMFTKIDVRANPALPSVGQNVRLFVIGTAADGTTSVLTARSRFTVLEGSADLNGPTLVPRAIGAIRIEASFAQGDRVLRAETSLRVVEKTNALTALRIEPSNPGALEWNQQLSFTATAVYADGSSKDVTASTRFSASNLILGYFTNATLHAGNSGTGVLRVTAQYTENSIQKSAVVELSIVSP